MRQALLLRFRVADEVVAIPAQRAGEVVELGHVTRVPGAPPGVLGLVDRHGRIVTVVDPGAIVHGRAALAPPLVAVVLAPPHAHLALAVQPPVDTVRLDSDKIARVELPSDGSLAYVIGTAEHGGEVLGLLDTDAFVAGCDAHVRAHGEAE